MGKKQVDVYKTSSNENLSIEDTNYFMAQALQAHIMNDCIKDIDRNESSNPNEDTLDYKLTLNHNFITIDNALLNQEKEEGIELVEDLEIFGKSFNEIKLTIAEANMVNGKFYSTFAIPEKFFKSEELHEAICEFYEENGNSLHDNNQYEDLIIEKIEIDIDVIKEDKKKPVKKVSKSKTNAMKG